MTPEEKLTVSAMKAVEVIELFMAASHDSEDEAIDVCDQVREDVGVVLTDVKEARDRPPIYGPGMSCPRCGFGTEGEMGR